MPLIVVALALLAALACAWLLWRSRRAAPPVRAATGPARPLRTPVPPARPAHPADTAAAPAIVPLPELPPEALGSFDWLAAETLPAGRRQALVAAVRRIPRPPAALHQLLSPQFLDRASSNALSALITGEAQIAAKVLASVNSPFYGLQRPVSGIGQAVTFLGLNTVRSICLQCLLDDAFKPGNPALKQACDQIWNASTLARELCTRLSAKLGLADAPALVAQVLLSFLGHLATALLLAEQQTKPGLLARCQQAQAQLGLTPAESAACCCRNGGCPAPSWTRCVPSTGCW